MPRAKTPTAEAEPDVEKAQARAPSASPRRSRASRAAAVTRDADPAAAAELDDPATLTDGAIAAGDTGADVEISGHPELSSAARPWDPPTPPPWSFPSGIIAGRDTPKTVRLEAPMNPSLGPEGQRRSPLALVALSIVTLGVYSLVWHNRINTEIADFDTRMYVRAGRSSFAITLAWLIGAIVSAIGAVLVVTTQMQVSLPLAPSLSLSQMYLLLGGIVVVPYLVILIPFSLVAAVMTLERVRIAEDRAGRTTDVQLRPPRDVCWLLVPVIGGLVLIAVMQRRLNQVWEIAAPTPVARITRY